MKNETVKFSVENAYGKPVKDYGVQVDGVLLTKVEAEFPFSSYEKRDEIAATDQLDDDEYTAAVNARRKAKARAAATTKALDAVGIKKPDQNDPAVVRENNIKLLMKTHGISEELARKIQAQNDEMIAAMKAAGATV